MENTTKKRAPNFTHTEKSFLVEVVAREAAIIESKTTNAVSRSEKHEAWQRVAELYNATSGYSHRSVDSLKVAWDNMKKTARKAASERKKDFYLTGGGSSNAPRLTPADEAVLKIISISATGLENEFDGDAGEEIGKVECASTIDTTPRATRSDSHDDSMDVLYEMDDGSIVPGHLLTVETVESEPETQELLPHTPDNDMQETPPNDGSHLKAVTTHKWRDVVPRMMYQRKNPALMRSMKQKSTIADQEGLAKVLKRRAPSMSLNDQLLTEKILLTKALRVGQELDNDKKRVDLELDSEKKRVELEILKLELAKKLKKEMP